ncbi:MAG: hypothetical protein ABR585_00975 [Gemmatimonadaceae bacterium]
MARAARSSRGTITPKRIVWSVTIVVLLAACKAPSPSEQMDSILSWFGTAGMAGQAWVNHTTPEKYTRQTLELSEQTIRQLSDDLLHAPPTGIDTAALDAVLSRSSNRIAQIARLVGARNAPEVVTQLDSLRTDERIVKQFADSIESKQ